MFARPILILVLFSAMAVAQQSPAPTIPSQFSGQGSYDVTNAGYAANLHLTGQFGHIGPVEITGNVQEVEVLSDGTEVCTFYFLFQQTLPDGSTGLEKLEASGPNQTCKVQSIRDGTMSGTAHVTGGVVSTVGSKIARVQGGTLAFNLIGQFGGIQLNGTADLTLFPAPAQTAGPGGSGYPPIVAGPGGSGYPVVVNGANSGSVLVFNTDNSAATTSTLAHAANSPGSIQIPLPVQSEASTYNAAADCGSSTTSCWIQFPTSTGLVAANSGGTINANVNPQGLSLGVYPALVAITITPTGDQNLSPTVINLPLTAIVASEPNLLGLSQTGLQFQAIAGAPTQSQWISISNLGPGSLPLSLSSTQPEAESWLAAFEGGSTATATAPVTAEIEANPAGLAPGTYFGRVNISAPEAVDTPQSVDVALTVLPASNNSTPNLSATALTFVASGNTPPAGQQVQLSNLSDVQAPVITTVGTNDGANWLTVSPATGTAITTQPFTATIMVQPQSLLPGVYQGSVVFQNTNDSSTYPVSVQLIVPNPAPCTPTQLLPIVVNLSTGSNIFTALPVPLEAQIVDDCGTPMTTGAVVAFFSSGDPAVTMQPTENGKWTGTWFPHDIVGGEVDVTVSAGSFAPLLSGSITVGSVVSANPAAPVVSQAGVVSAAAPTTHLPVAPGGFISIFGFNLATARASAASLPLPTTLADTQVLLGGQPLALDFADTGQINAIVPFGIQPNTIQQLTVIHNGISSPPETLVVAPAVPTVFTQDQSGTGAGVIFVVKPDGQQFLNAASTPASAGDALVIYCSGLGAVTPPVPDGSAAPSSPTAKTTTPITATIGGKTAPVTFSGLVPGYVGLYQVNVTVPPGITPAADVPLLITAGSASSPVVTLAIQ
jgi:uncharacterized protein (TIGR03437 family)